MTVSSGENAPAPAAGTTAPAAGATAPASTLTAAAPVVTPVATPTDGTVVGRAATPPPFFGPKWSGPGRSAPPLVLAGSGLAGVAAAAALPWDRAAIGWLLTGAVASVAVHLCVWRRPSAPSAPTQPRRRADRLVATGWTLVALALVGVGTVRGATWLFLLCVPAALLAWLLAAAGGRSLRGILLGALSSPIASVRALPWAARGIRRTPGGSGGSAGRTAAAVVVTLALLVVFGALLARADVAFANLVDVVLPTIDRAVVMRWVLSAVVVGGATLAACFLALAPPAFDGGERAGRRLRRVEWALPVGGLVALFAVFVAVQATVLFGGGRHVLRTSGLTYAEYARSGFWQLLTVTALTLMVIAGAAGFASRESRLDWAWLRVLLGSLAVLSLVIVASALSRMWAYEQAYGFTRLRLLVSAFELFLGMVFLLVLAAGVRRRASWLPSFVVLVGLLTLLGVAALNPDRFIADQNITRYERTRIVDTEYLASLSADAVPALDRLPEPMRTCVLIDIHDALSRMPDSWREWNAGRAEARRILAGDRAPSPEARADCSQRRGSGRF